MDIYALVLMRQWQDRQTLIHMHKSFVGCISAAVFIFLCSTGLSAQGPDNVIPVPSEVVMSSGTYRFEGEPSVKTVLVKKGFDSPEAYSMKITPKGITVKALSETGFFYAMKTLDMMTRNGKVNEISCCEINDSPRFGYRGLHVDVSRHFRSVDFLKKQLDAMAAFKMNRMHLHLTDGAGWRLKIEAYPRLTEFAAWRPHHIWKDWWESDRHYAEEGSAGAYGGYYTKEDMLDLIEYAHERHIEVIPEIEMPGHSEEAIAAYPELGCNGKQYGQGDFCPGNEKTFEFLETVLDEVMEIFPSEYIHIGGDEAGKGSWKTCPKCQERMRAEGLADVDELQSYLIRRIDRYVSSKGRKIIGWDEILDGGLAEGATVMSWRGTKGGIESMKMGHDVIMCPGNFCYLDHAQDAPFVEPESIGGYLPLDMVYGYEPQDDSMPCESLHHLKGVQANLWSEYIPTDSHAEYMYWPRAIAIAETGWSSRENRDYESFRTRVLPVLEQMREDGYSTFSLENEYGERKLVQTGIRHKAVGAAVTYGQPINQSYPGAGETALTDGIAGGWSNSDGRWQGFLSDFDVTVDLGEVMPVHYVGATFMQIAGPYIFMPEKAEIFVSEDGKDFRRIAQVWNDVSVKCPDLLFRSFDTVCDEQARYIRYTAKQCGIAGGWLFVDEIVVN